MKQIVKWMLMGMLKAHLSDPLGKSCLSINVIPSLDPSNVCMQGYWLI